MTNREILERKLIDVHKKQYSGMTNKELARRISDDPEFLCQDCPVQHLCLSKQFENNGCESMLILYMKTTGIF